MMTFGEVRLEPRILCDIGPSQFIQCSEIWVTDKCSHFPKKRPLPAPLASCPCIGCAILVYTVGRQQIFQTGRYFGD
jgi:hypothetical protein